MTLISEGKTLGSTGPGRAWKRCAFGHGQRVTNPIVGLGTFGVLNVGNGSVQARQRSDERQDMVRHNDEFVKQTVCVTVVIKSADETSDPRLSSKIPRLGRDHISSSVVGRALPFGSHALTLGAGAPLSIRPCLSCPKSSRTGPGFAYQLTLRPPRGRLSFRLLHQLHEIFEQVMSIVRARRCLRVKLHGEERQIPMSHAFQCAVVQIDVGQINLALRQ